MPTSPTVPPPQPKGLNRVLSRNIAELQQRREAERRDASFQQKLAGAVTDFAGSMAFVYLHLAVVVFWALANFGWLPGVPRFDSSFVGLATITSVEGIFLTTFVLVSQNRDAGVADRRADLDLQINLLAEHEVTRLISLVRAIAEKHGIEADGEELAELERDVAPEAVADGLKASKA